MSCKLLICSECTTRVDGRGLCASCVTVTEQASPKASAPKETKAAVGLSIAMLMVLVLLTWSFLEITLPGSAWW